MFKLTDILSFVHLFIFINEASSVINSKTTECSGNRLQIQLTLDAKILLITLTVNT